MDPNNDIPPPETYVCSWCLQKGSHYAAFCHLNTDPKSDYQRRRSTRPGVPINDKDDGQGRKRKSNEVIDTQISHKIARMTESSTMTRHKDSSSTVRNGESLKDSVTALYVTGVGPDPAAVRLLRNVDRGKEVSTEPWGHRSRILHFKTIQDRDDAFNRLPDVLTKAPKDSTLPFVGICRVRANQKPEVKKEKALVEKSAQINTIPRGPKGFEALIKQQHVIHSRLQDSKRAEDGRLKYDDDGDDDAGEEGPGIAKAGNYRRIGKPLLKSLPSVCEM